MTSGTQQALDLIARVFLNPGDVVAVEEPGYPPARLVFESHGARVVAVGFDGNGINISALPHDTKLVFLTPSHQYPTGISMPLTRRWELLGWAEHHNTILIEDDYDCEYRYSERPVDTLHSLDRSGRVLYLGSFSKTMLPSLRIGFIAASSSLARPLQQAKLLADGHCPVTTQAALASFIDSGLLAAHIRRTRQEYRQRREVILTTLERDFSAWLTPIPSGAGLHLAATSTALDVDTLHVVQKKAAGAEVAISCLSDFYHDQPGEPGLLFGFGAIATTSLEDGLEHLRQCFVEAI